MGAKYTIDLGKQVILPIRSSSNTDEGDYNPEIETWLIDQLESRLEYLKLIKQHGYDVADSEITNLEKDILNRIQKLTFKVK